MDLSLTTSVVGLVVSGASAIYARNSAVSAHRQAEIAERALAEARQQSRLALESVRAAKTQNEIELQERRVDVYKTLLEVKRRFGVMAAGKDRDALNDLLLHSELSKFYFSDEVSKSMLSLAADFVYLRTLADQLDRQDFYSDDELATLKKKRFDFFRATEGRVEGVLQQLQPFVLVRPDA